MPRPYIVSLTPLPQALHRQMSSRSLLFLRDRARGYQASKLASFRSYYTSIPCLQTHSRLDALKTTTVRPFSDFLTDGFGRQHDYLRISLTERCNLRCVYCMPEDGVKLSPADSNLTTPEIIHLASLFVREGVSKIRLTGGEPTVRKDFIPLLQQLGALKLVGLRELCVTSNGISLERKLDAMVEAGLTGLNISLDTLDPYMFTIMTRRKGFDAVERAIARVLEMNRVGGGVKLKINVVVMRGVNDHEILPFIEKTRDSDLEVRFIEYMPFQGNKWETKKMVPYSEMLDSIRSRFPSITKVVDGKNETSKTYHIPGFSGRVGFITSMTHNFCSSCNRLRITSDGSIKVCLFDNSEISLRDMVRQATNGRPILQSDIDNGTVKLSREQEGNADLLEVIGAAVKNKKSGHVGMETLSQMKNRPMVLIDDPPFPFSGLSSSPAPSSSTDPFRCLQHKTYSVIPYSPTSSTRRFYSRGVAVRSSQLYQNGDDCPRPTSGSSFPEDVCNHPSLLPSTRSTTIDSTQDLTELIYRIDMFMSYSENMVRATRQEFEGLDVTQSHRFLRQELEKRRQRFGPDALTGPRGFGKFDKTAATLEEIGEDETEAVNLKEVEAEVEAEDEVVDSDLHARALSRKLNGKNKRRLRRLRDRRILQAVANGRPAEDVNMVSRLPLSVSSSISLSGGSSPVTGIQPNSRDEYLANPNTTSDTSYPAPKALPHLNPRTNAPRMVSVTDKPNSARTAYAIGQVIFSHHDTYSSLMSHYNNDGHSTSNGGVVRLRKGDPLAVAHIAGIQAAKMLPQIVPLCHPIMITHVDIDIQLIHPHPSDTFTPVGVISTHHHPLDKFSAPCGGVSIAARVSTFGPTGVEMEALAAVSGSGLAIVDMLKAVDKHMMMGGMKVVGKSGGKSGDWWEEGWETLGEVMDGGDR